MSAFVADEGELLEAGYGSRTPAGDNALLDYARAEPDAFAAIAVAVGGRVANDARLGVWLADTGSQTPFGNTAHLTKPVADDALPTLTSTLREFFSAAPGGPFMVFSPWPIGDLSRFGFHRVGHPPLMLRPATVPPLPANPNLRIAVVETADGCADFEQTLIDAYPVPELQPWQRAAFLNPAVLTTQWRFFLGYDGDRCVATPGETAMLIASDLGRPAYDKLGYIPLLRYTLYVGPRASNGGT